MKNDLVSLMAKSGFSQNDQELPQLLNSGVSSIRSLDDLFRFFDKNLKEVRLSLANQKHSNPQQPVFELNSVIDLYLKRCLFTFSTLMFEDLSRLFDAFLAYKEGRDYKFTQSAMKLEYWAEEKAFKLENEAVKRDYSDVKTELDRVKAPNFY